MCSVKVSYVLKLVFTNEILTENEFEIKEKNGEKWLNL